MLKKFLTIATLSLVAPTLALAAPWSAPAPIVGRAKKSGSAYAVKNAFASGYKIAVRSEQTNANGTKNYNADIRNSAGSLLAIGTINFRKSKWQPGPTALTR